jgi:hypothetical protein
MKRPERLHTPLSPGELPNSSTCFTRGNYLSHVLTAGARTIPELFGSCCTTMGRTSQGKLGADSAAVRFAAHEITSQLVDARRVDSGALLPWIRVKTAAFPADSKQYIEDLVVAFLDKDSRRPLKPAELHDALGLVDDRGFDFIVDLWRNLLSAQTKSVMVPKSVNKGDGPGAKGVVVPGYSNGMEEAARRARFRPTATLAPENSFLASPERRRGRSGIPETMCPTNCQVQNGIDDSDGAVVTGSVREDVLVHEASSDGQPITSSGDPVTRVANPSAVNAMRDDKSDRKRRRSSESPRSSRPELKSPDAHGWRRSRDQSRPRSREEDRYRSRQDGRSKQDEPIHDGGWDEPRRDRRSNAKRSDRDRDHNRGSDRYLDGNLNAKRVRDFDREVNRDQDLNGERDRNRNLNLEHDRDRDRNRNRNRKRDRNRDRDRNRNLDQSPRRMMDLYDQDKRSRYHSDRISRGAELGVKKSRGDGHGTDGMYDLEGRPVRDSPCEGRDSNGEKRYRFRPSDSGSGQVDGRGRRTRDHKASRDIDHKSPRMDEHEIAGLISGERAPSGKFAANGMLREPMDQLTDCNFEAEEDVSQSLPARDLNAERLTKLKSDAVLKMRRAKALASMKRPKLSSAGGSR